MVRQSLLSFLILILSYSCSKPELTRLDSMLVYQNYTDSLSINFDSLKDKIIVNDHFLFSNKFNNTNKYLEIKGMNKEIFLNEYHKMEDNYHKTNSGSDYIKFIPRKNAEHIYYCGRLQLNKNVKSLLFLYRYDFGMMPETFETSPISMLILYSFKDGKLCSIVVLSDEFSKSKDYRLVTQERNNYLFSYNYINPELNNARVVFYTSFYIDDIGYVRFQFFPEKEISQYYSSVVNDIQNK